MRLLLRASELGEPRRPHLRALLFSYFLTMSDAPKKPIFKKWWFWTIALVVLIGIAGYNGNQPMIVTPSATLADNTNSQTAPPATQPPAIAPKSFKIGDNVKLGDYILVVKAAEDCVPTNQFTKAANGKKFVSIDISQENDGAQPVDYNVFDYKLQTADDFTYSPTFMACKDPGFASGTLQKGQKTRGYLTFEIPKDSTQSKLFFTPNMFSTEQIVIDLQ